MNLFLDSSQLLGKSFYSFLRIFRFTEDKIFFQKSNYDLANPKINKGKICEIQNFGDMIFQIWPSLNYEAHQEYLEISKTIMMMKQNLKKRKPVPRKSQKDKIKKVAELQNALLETYEKQLIELISRKKSEEAVNKNLLNINQGKYVNYGQEIQLMHYQSKQFLNGKIVCSTVD